jgi:iron complex transport system permease protein
MTRTLRLTRSSLIMTALLVVACVLALTQGAYVISWSAWLNDSLSRIDHNVLINIRLPRLILALVVGAALAASGTVLQALFRNPLADPGLLGISAGASVAVGVMIVVGDQLVTTLPALPDWALTYANSVAAFVGAVLTCAFIFRLAKHQGQVSVVHLLLAGIAINALAGAATGLLTYVSTDEQLRSLTFWAMGSLGGARWEQVAVLLTLLIPALIYLWRQAQILNLVLLGDEEMRYLGVDAERVKRRLVAASALAVGICVAFSGLIGFIGLMVPHLVRLMVGADNRLVFPLSMLLGAALLTFADTLARVVVIPAEMPVGLMTSLLGGPFFLWLLLRSMKGGDA